MTSELSYNLSKTDAAVMVGFIAWVFLYGEVGIGVARWQAELLGGSEYPLAVMGVWIVGFFAPVLVAGLVWFMRGDRADDV